jgi:hypothetical protein
VPRSHRPWKLPLAETSSPHARVDAFRTVEVDVDLDAKGADLDDAVS